MCTSQTSRYHQEFHMASGKTLELLALTRYKGARQRMQEDRQPRERDRSLNGKARKKARKAAKQNG
jgi:hypothetical protein